MTCGLLVSLDPFCFCGSTQVAKTRGLSNPGRLGLAWGITIYFFRHSLTRAFCWSSVIFTVHKETTSVGGNHMSELMFASEWIGLFAAREIFTPYLFELHSE